MDSAVALLMALLLGQDDPSRSAPAASDAPAGELRIYRDQGSQVRWSGSGPVTRRIRLCVTSNTGRYRLEVNRVQAALITSIRFIDATGAEQVAPVSANVIIGFDGADPQRGVSCERGPNAWLEIQMSEEALLSGTAGAHLESLQVTATPF